MIFNLTYPASPAPAGAAATVTVTVTVAPGLLPQSESLRCGRRGKLEPADPDRSCQCHDVSIMMIVTAARAAAAQAPRRRATSADLRGSPRSP
jgi:hypothetical protein